MLASCHKREPLVYGSDTIPGISSETLKSRSSGLWRHVVIWLDIGSHNPEDRDLYPHRRENHKSHILVFVLHIQIIIINSHIH